MTPTTKVMTPRSEPTTKPASCRAARPGMRRLSLALLGRLLRETEQEDCLINARRLASALDYDTLTALARRGLAGDRRNRPELIGPRFMLLLGMTGPRVVAFQQALCSLGFPLELTGNYDEPTLAAYRGWLAREGRLG